MGCEWSFIFTLISFYFILRTSVFRIFVWGDWSIVHSSARIRNEFKSNVGTGSRAFRPMGHCRCPCLHSVTLGFGFTVSGGTTSSITFQFSRTCSDRASLFPSRRWEEISLPAAGGVRERERTSNNLPTCQFTARQRMRPFNLTVCKSCFSQGFWTCQASSVNWACGTLSATRAKPLESSSFFFFLAWDGWLRLESYFERKRNSRGHWVMAV